jgi:hypothetical protein
MTRFRGTLATLWVLVIAAWLLAGQSTTSLPELERALDGGVRSVQVAGTGIPSDGSARDALQEVHYRSGPWRHVTVVTLTPDGPTDDVLTYLQGRHPGLTATRIPLDEADAMVAVAGHRPPDLVLVAFVVLLVMTLVSAVAIPGRRRLRGRKIPRPEASRV